MSFLFGFWVGLFAGIGGYWLYANPDKRALVIEKIRTIIKG